MTKRTLKIKNRKWDRIFVQKGHIFDSLTSFRGKTSHWDLYYYIFKMNNGKLNDGLTYVFKMSTLTAKIPCEMDVISKSYLNSEWAFFDRTFKRFVTLGAHMFHPLADKIVKLTCMEANDETTNSVEVFWKLFNRVLQDYRDDPAYKLNPVKLLFDEFGGNWLGVEREFGSSLKNRSKTCTFHFQQTVRTHAAKLPTEEEKEKFLRLATWWLDCVTSLEYQVCHDALVKFSLKTDVRKKAMFHWKEWWHKRRTNIFKPFCLLSYHALTTNFAEAQHEKYKIMRGVQLALLDAAYEETAEFIETEDMINGLENGTTPFSSAATSEGARSKEYRKQQSRAKKYAEDISRKREWTIPLKEEVSLLFSGTFYRNPLRL